MDDLSSSEKKTKTYVKGDTEEVELVEKGKGVIVIDIPNQDSKTDLSKDDSKERVKDLIDTLETPEDMNLQRMKHIFDLIDDELVEEYEKTIGPLENITLESTTLDGLNTRRSEVAILAFILKISKAGAKKTKILYDANLSGRQLKNYLSFLVSTGFIKEKPIPKKGSLFITPAKGKVFLSYWSKILSLVDQQESNSQGSA